MRADRVIRQKSHTAARVLRSAWNTGCKDGFSAGFSILGTTAKALLRKRTPRPLSEFDRTYGVDTGGIVPIAAMEVNSANYVHGIHYQASKPDELRSVLQSLPLDHEEFTFVDFGSGKGMALLVASFFPFRRIIGVEFAADLHRIAQTNIASFLSQAANVRCRNVESVLADAAEWKAPNTPLLCYFYEPFELPVLTRVIDKLASSWRQTPRPIVLVYHHATSTSLLYEGSLKNHNLILESNVFRLATWQREPYRLYAAGVDVMARVAAPSI